MRGEDTCAPGIVWKRPKVLPPSQEPLIPPCPGSMPSDRLRERSGR